MRPSNPDDAKRIAKRYPVPTGNQYIRLPSIEVLHEWLSLNNRRVVGWRGDFLVVEPIPDAVSSTYVSEIIEEVIEEVKAEVKT